MEHPSSALTHPRCTRWGHKYQARYDRIPPESITEYEGSVNGFNALCKRVYVRDVCTRCGRTIERNET